MKQPIRKSNKATAPISNKKNRVVRHTHKPKKTHPQYGTSKLEEDFARNFLDKLGIDYIYQFEAKDIGRYYDFFIPDNKNGFDNGAYTSGLIVEIDGSYFHGDPRIYEQKDLNKMQLRNQKIDAYKNEWAYRHGFPIMRIWEKDIRENPQLVMERLKERLYIQEEKKRKKGRNLGQNS